MEINEETYRLFDRYFTGNLSAEERADFEKALAVNEKFRDEFQWLSIAVTEIRMNGRHILKKQLAEIGAAIPASAFEKYTPSIKPKSFFKKWWWAIAVIAAAAGLALAWLATRGPGGDESGVQSSEFGVSEADQADRPAGDSFMEDSATASPFGSPLTPPDTARIDPAAIGECCSYSVNALYKNEIQYGEMVNGQMVWVDTIPPYLTATSSWATLTVECCPQKTKPAFYSYQDRITLSAAYADTSGLRFMLHANELIMTDGKPGYFILTKGAKEKPLERINPAKTEGKKGARYEPGSKTPIKLPPQKK